MLATDQERLKEELQALTKRYGRDRTALLPILQELQRKQRHISPYAMQVVADLLGIHPVEVYSVVSFYGFLDDKPQGRFVIRLCRTISCDLAGRDRIAQQLENDLGIAFGQTTPDGMFTLEWANCMGMCDQGPALLVNDRVYTRVAPDSVHDILEECRSAFGLHATQKEQEHLA
jgi:[NiFe] hydrogenase diaphorase moiety large subunit